MTVSRQGGTGDASSIFAEEVAKVRVELAAARSAALLQLFDFLVERSNDERSPKEIEIALAVFGRDGAQDPAASSSDSGVRVYVHRLRKRLGDFYAGKPGPKLEVPKGEYRIVLVTEPEAQEKPARAKPPLAPAALGLGVLLVLLALGYGVSRLWPSRESEPEGRELRMTAFWQPLAAGGRAQIVVGDTFMVAETEDQQAVQRMVQEPGIRSREDLGAYLKTHPDAFYRLYDLDLNFTPVGSAIAAWNVQDAVSLFRTGSAGHVSLTPASQLGSGMMGSESVVYVGRFSNLGRVAAPLFKNSGVRLGGAYDELVDQASGKRYVASIGGAGDQVDYGYIASLSGPLGKHIFVIAGVGDAAVQNMASLVSTPDQLRGVETRAGIHGDYEALFEIPLMGDTALDRRPVLVRAIR